MSDLLPSTLAHSSPLSPLEKEERLGRVTALLSAGAGIFLSFAKIVVGLYSGSNAVVSDGLETAGDVLCAAVVYAGLRLAQRPADAEHPYGHGRYETLAGLAVGGILLLTGAGILWHTITAPFTHSVLKAYTIYPLFAAVFVKVGFAVAKFRIGKRIDSSGLQADAWHDVTDLVSTSIALAAVGLNFLDPLRFAFADRAGSLAISILVLFLAVQVTRRTVGSLLDTMPEPARMRQIRNVAITVPGALGIEKCYARRTGLKYHVDLHLEVAPEMTVRESHYIASRVKIAVKANLPWVADVLIHVEPSKVEPAKIPDLFKV